MALPVPSRPGVYIAADYAAITPSDTVNFTKGPCTAIYVGGAGIVEAVKWDDTTVQFTCPAGITLQICAKRINAGNSTATLLVALY